jgi:O-methyltransferase
MMRRPQGPVARLRAAQREAARHKNAAKRTLAKLERERAASAAKLARLSGQLEELRQSYHLSGAGKKLDLREIAEFSEIAEGIIADGRTGMNYDRLYTLWQAVRAAPKNEPAIEIGGYRGGSSRFIGEAFKAAGHTPRLYVCDTFTGPVETDPRFDLGHSNSQKYETVSAEETAEYMSGYPAVELVVGDIVETSRQLPEESYGLVHVDVNYYPSTAFCLRYFAPRLVDGALTVIDDYGFVTCPGVKQAADEFVAEFPQYRLWHLLTGQALLWRLPAPE